ncbi:MAG: type II toxin-antitoxin system VapC family toxin [Acidobacteriota bacterium]
MTIVDTNVISEIMRLSPADSVRAWFSSHPRSSLFTTSISKAEILFGLEIMPIGRRRTAFEKEAEITFSVEFAGRILPFDSDAARAFAQIAASQRSKGRPMSEFDAQIAAIARSLGATLATRNTVDFEHCGIELVNPWDTE